MADAIPIPNDPNVTMPDVSEEAFNTRPADGAEPDDELLATGDYDDMPDDEELEEDDGDEDDGE